MGSFPETYTDPNNKLITNNRACTRFLDTLHNKILHVQLTPTVLLGIMKSFLVIHEIAFRSKENLKL